MATGGDFGGAWWLWAGGVAAFLTGAAMGNLARLWADRLPWEQSILWPSRRLPGTHERAGWARGAPLAGWFLTRAGGHRARFRDLATELTGGLLILGLYQARIWGPIAEGGGTLTAGMALTLGYQSILTLLLLTAALTDIDYKVIPAPITDAGMALGLALGTIAPGARLAPNAADTAWGGLLEGLTGMAVGAGLVLGTRAMGRVLFRKEAMGLGDLTLMGLIGAFLGWQITIPTFFLAAFIGLGHALFKVCVKLGKWMTGRKIGASDNEMFFGPYLCAAAYLLTVFWPEVWEGRLREGYEGASVLFWYLAGYPVDL